MACSLTPHQRLVLNGLLPSPPLKDPPSATAQPESRLCGHLHSTATTHASVPGRTLSRRAAELRKLTISTHANPPVIRQAGSSATGRESAAAGVRATLRPSPGCAPSTALPGRAAAAAGAASPAAAAAAGPAGATAAPRPASESPSLFLQEQQQQQQQQQRRTISLAYELVQGALVRWSDATPRTARQLPPPTAVLVHGILGSRKNFGSFAKRLAQAFPSWQFLLVDLRCHGDSAGLSLTRPHTVESAARDVLQLVAQLRLVPRVLIGHSFGGKVVLSMADQAAKPLARPVQVWVLDATPGTVRAGGDGEDHPAELIKALRAMPRVIYDRKEVVRILTTQGFSTPVAQWMTTNLKQADIADAPQGNGAAAKGLKQLQWQFDLDGIAEMYRSYENTNLWPLVEDVPEGVHIEFLRAERSLHRWAHDDISRIATAEAQASQEGAGVKMHVLADSGHGVHTDNPDGLFRIIAPSFGNQTSFP